MKHKKFYCIYIGLIVFVLFQPRISWAYEKEIRELSTAMVDNITKSGKTRIAVVDFTDLQGNVTELGRFIAEEFSVMLLEKRQGFEIVDRTHLQTLIKEHKLSSTGLIDPSTAQKLGQIAGVDALVTGTITSFGDSVRISVKILDVKSAKLIGANAGNIPATEAIKSLLGTGIQSGGSILPGPIVPKTELQAQQMIEAKGFTFALQKCTRSGDSVTFYFMVTNNKEDRSLQLNGNNGNNTRIFDNLGNEYIATLAQLGNSSSQMFGYCDLVTDIPTRASITVEKIAPQATYIALLELSCWSSELRGFNVQFRNVQFSK